MKIVFFVHSLLSDWNHGNAHFLRGVLSELVARGHEVAVHEPRDAWSVENLVADHGQEALERFRDAYPTLATNRYDLTSLDVDAALDGADLVIVHEWNDHALVARIGESRARDPRFRLLFHDTHHRAVTAPEAMAGYDLRYYDGVLAFGEVIRDLYLDRGWAQSAWTWHEAADTRVFRPAAAPREGDLVWVGNWGDEERTAELHEFLIDPVADLRLRAVIHGVRYPQNAVRALSAAAIDYRGWIANFDAPATFARYAFTVHVPRRPYVEALPGIPTIRVFEALACGIPLISAPWHDAEGLFRPGTDFLVARNGAEMRQMMRAVLNDAALAQSLVAAGLETILDRHTCRHRVDELLEIAAVLGAGRTTAKEMVSV